MSVWGQCVHWGASVAIKIGPCPTCQVDVAFRRDLASGRVDVIGAGSDVPHVHPAPLVVEWDPLPLLEALRAPVPAPPALPSPRPPERPTAPPAPRNGDLGGIPRLTP